MVRGEPLSQAAPDSSPTEGSLWRNRSLCEDCQGLSYKEQRRRPPPVAETGSRCWGRGQQDASDSAAAAGSRNPGSGIASAMTERLD